MDNNHQQNKHQLSGKLSIEQQFHLSILDREIEHLTLEQAREHLREAFRQIMVKENICKEMFKSCYL